MVRSVIFIVLPIVAFAQGSAVGVSYLRLPLIARSASLGESLVAAPGQVGAVSFNPANLYRLKGGEIVLSHVGWIQDVQTEFFSVGYPLSVGTVGVSIVSSSVRDIEIRDRPGPAISTFSARSAYLQASFASTFDTTLRFGVNAKLLYEKIYVDEATGFALDLGVLYHSPIDGLVAGVSIANIGSMSALANERSELPRQARLGLSYRFPYEDFDFMSALQFTQEAAGVRNNLHLGLEALYHQVVTVRLGYQSGYEARTLSAGLGVRYEWVKFDYAYVPFAFNLGNAHLFTLGFSF